MATVTVLELVGQKIIFYKVSKQVVKIKILFRIIFDQFFLLLI
jgi:hypothetical protein